jgi:hypothetical protein
MYIEVTQGAFRDAFQRAGYGNNFSYDGLTALYEYMQEYEESTGEKIELDVVALACEWGEYSDLEEFNKEHSTEHESIEELEQETQVLQAMNSILVAAY